MLPPFNALGDLPAGIHPATLANVLDRLGGGTPQRVAVGQRLERIHRIATATGHLARLLVFGSFVTDKPEPRDLDVFLLMDDGFDASQVTGEAALLFDHSAADAHFGASVFWLRRLTAWGGEQSVIEFWQSKRDGGQRGIVEVIAENP